ncbi:sensor histidine kinase [Curtobacterium sp. RRHDQ10]|uniref:sensor histidine kinase n=1 Tax=Curtobacterium phyllosphaerae TaxID=3413379 RepID=UPI003BF1EA8B
MTSDTRAASAPDPVTGQGRTPLGRGLNLFGVGVVAVALVTQAPDRPVLVVVLGGAAVGLWLTSSFVRDRAVRLACLVAMLVLGAATTGATSGLLIAPVIAAVVALEGDEHLRAWVGLAAAGLAAGIDLVIAAVTAASVGFLFATLGGIALALLGGYSRRQNRTAARQRDEIAAERLAAEREQERNALLADRARAARDVHDVLAHSLGGLVLQLDAVEALLEAGRTADAARRAGDARRLAADGLAEARRAVATLRDPGVEDAVGPVPEDAVGPVPEDAVGPVPEVRQDTSRPGGAVPVAHPAAVPQSPGSGTLAALVEAHRSFGGAVTVHGDVALAAVDARHRATLVAATREALSNARRHAPGAPVDLEIAEADGTVVVTVSNPVAVTGHGLVGIRERFADLRDASSVDVGAAGDDFVVAMRVPAAGVVAP